MTASCRVCRRPLTRSAEIGPVCARREAAAFRPAFPPAVLPPKRRSASVSRTAARSRVSALIPGQTELDLT